jgi:HD-GYP domain-containing protein (c-di-GMP phosphodiesterase class II)/ribonuclease BN (tRNA processing enzyme)
MQGIKILGSYGNRVAEGGTTSFLIDEEIAIDAGNLSREIGLDIVKLNHIFISHSHFDHIADLPFVIDTNFSDRKETLKIYGLKETLKEVKNLFNDKIWPDFTKINLLNNKPSIEFIEIKINQTIKLKEFEIKFIEANHTVPTVGFKITKNDKSLIISSDTYLNEELINQINNTKNLSALFLECSFPSKFKKLAKDSKHLTPKTVKEIISKTDIKNIFFYHFKYEYKNEIINELIKLKLIKSINQILNDNECVKVFSDLNIQDCNKTINDKTNFNKLITIGQELSKQQNIDYLLEDILSVAREFTNADGGSVYIKQNDKLYFKIIQNDTLNTFMGGRNKKIEWPPLNLYKNGKENSHMVAVLSALKQKIFNIPDVYLNEQFDFSGTKQFDKTTGYRSKSMLVIPLINHKNETIGILQLINKKTDNIITPFSKEDEEIIMSLASQAAVSITKNRLIEELEDFIESFIKVVAKAVDEKSKYTGNHVQKVAKLATIMSEEIDKDNKYFENVKYNQNMLKQIKIAALLHDIGKITTNPVIMDKSTKLETVVDRIDIISERVEIIKRDLLLKGKNNFKELLDDFEFIKKTNIGREFMSDDKIKKIDEIAHKYKYLLGNKEVSILKDDEANMLKIRKGTLSTEERKHIERHALMTLEMLSSMPFPKEYSEVTHIAANHHEKLNCKGYPRGLCEKDLTLEDRMIAICDIFEALTASDRPYKTPKKLSEVFKIMEFMVKNNEIDKKLFEFFVEKKIWKKYGELKESQIDI